MKGRAVLSAKPWSKLISERDQAIGPYGSKPALSWRKFGFRLAREKRPHELLVAVRRGLEKTTAKREKERNIGPLEQA